jgi:hypothetical protein
MRVDKKKMLQRCFERIRGRKPAGAARAGVPKFSVKAPPLSAFAGGRTQAVEVSFASSLPIESGTVTLEADGGSVVPMLFDQPKLFRPYGKYPQWCRYIESYQRIGTVLALYDDHDAHVATIEVVQPRRPWRIAAVLAPFGARAGGGVDG